MDEGNVLTGNLVAPYLTRSAKMALRALLGLSAFTVVAHGCAVGLLLLLARSLTPAQFGVVSFALAAQAYLVVLGSFSCGSVVIREAVRRPADLDAVTTAFITLTAASSLLVCAAALLAIGLAPVSSGERWLLALFALGSVPASMTPQPLFDALHRQARGAMLTAFAELAALVAAVSLWWTGTLGLPTVGALYAGKWALATGCQLAAYHTTVRPLRWHRSPRELRLIASSSWPLLLASMLFFVPLSAGVMLVRLRAGLREAALYGLAYQVANAYQIFAALGVQVVQPHVYGEHGLHERFLARLGTFAVLFIGGGAVLALAGGEGVVRLLLPAFYRGSLTAMPWLLAAAAFLTVGRVLNAYLLRLGEERFILWAQLLSAVLYVGACLALPSHRVTTWCAVLAPCAVLVGVAACAWKIHACLRKARP